MVDCWRCQTAVTPILDRVWRPGGKNNTGTPAGVSGVGGIVSRTLSSRHMGTPFEDVAFTARSSDTIVRETESLVITKICDFRTTSLRGRTGRLRRTVRNPLRSDRFLQYCNASCHLNAGILKLKRGRRMWILSQADGAYPRPEGRGIAPAQPIRCGLGTHHQYINQQTMRSASGVG